MIRIKTRGNFKNVNSFLERLKENVDLSILDKYGRKGVAALSDATPKDTGLTSESWEYSITRERGKATLSFHNTNFQNGIPIAIILQYGHATRNGGWVEGIDYINPALQPILNKLANEAWEEMTR